MVSGSLDTSIKVWSVDSGKCLHTLVGHQSLTSGMELKDNILVSGNADSTVKIWDILTGECLKTLEGKYLLFGCSRFICLIRLLIQDRTNIKVQSRVCSSAENL